MHRKLNSLGKEQRLKSRKKLDFLFREGKRLTVPPLSVIWDMGPSKEQCGLKMAVGVSKRNFRKAADRNKIKRQLRETFRTRKSHFEDALVEGSLYCYVFINYIGREIPHFQNLERCMDLCIKELAEKLNNGTKPY